MFAMSPVLTCIRQKDCDNNKVVVEDEEEEDTDDDENVELPSDSHG
jgi:hypothetical protein